MKSFIQQMYFWCSLLNIFYQNLELVLFVILIQGDAKQHNQSRKKWVPFDARNGLNDTVTNFRNFLVKKDFNHFLMTF